MQDSLKLVFQGVLEGDRSGVEEALRKALEAGMEPEVILKEGMIAAMAEVGRLFEEGEYFVPEMLISARAMQTGLALLKPLLVEGNISSSGKVVIGTVQGDLHEIGKNLVAMMLEGAGFEVVDLGTDVAPEAFVEAVQQQHAQILGMSALLTTTMPRMKATINALEAAGMRHLVKVMIGGAPITQQFADEIGADGFSPDASKAVALAKSLLG